MAGGIPALATVRDVSIRTTAGPARCTARATKEAFVVVPSREPSGMAALAVLASTGARLSGSTRASIFALELPLFNRGLLICIRCAVRAGAGVKACSLAAVSVPEGRAEAPRMTLPYRPIELVVKPRHDEVSAPAMESSP